MRIHVKAIVLCVASAGMLQSQSPAQTVPVDLVTALAAGGGFTAAGSPNVQVGTLPVSFATAVKLPRGATILGSATLDQTTVGIFTFASDADSVLRIFESALMTSGWKAPAPPPSYPGFQQTPPPARQLTTTRMTLCGNGQVLTGVLLRQRSQVSTISLRVSTVTGPGGCNPRSLAEMMGPRQGPAFPTLYSPVAPSGASMENCYRSEGMGENSTMSRLRTSMTPDAIAEYYGKQLRDGGWSPKQELATPGLPPVVRRWTRPDSTGKPMELTLTVSAQARDTLCRSVTMDLAPAGAARP